jgi:ATP-dependent RNA helicase RhlE
MPDTVDAYTHRIGRTGRAARTGDAFTLVTGEDEPLVKAIERALGSRLERRKIPGFDYAVPAPKRDTEFARPPQPPRGPGRGKPSAARTQTGTPAGQGPAARRQQPAAAQPSGPPTTRRFRPRGPR